ncbi:hypothetical protein HPB47_020120 [Ixodes persulcatus]|uniref:Uncharacterized protein n=1 Tax=Ixodes persulcatus TaxID=34615 RepID=A0AC60QIH4_IXOPE|nr:hypothetical protein HPB47_020120 [Ixodes persulcatus]
MFKFTLFITQMLPWLFCQSETAMQFYVPRHDAADADPILLGSQDWLPTISPTSKSSAAGLFNHQRDLHDLRGLGVHAASKMFKFTLFITQTLTDCPPQEKEDLKAWCKEASDFLQQ